MTENQRLEVSVDRRQDVVSVQEPGYASTQQVTRDLAAERRLRIGMVNQIIWAILGLLEVLLGIRFLLRLMAANPDSGFATFIYGITKPFLAPFTALVGTPTAGGMVLEATTLIAMAVYALFFWIVVRAVLIAGNRPTARTATRSVREQMPGDPGNQRNTHTTTRS
jgi:uncharacterized protein YggT (Ycf19 family)